MRAVKPVCKPAALLSLASTFCAPPVRLVAAAFFPGFWRTVERVDATPAVA